MQNVIGIKLKFFIYKYVANVYKGKWKWDRIWKNVAKRVVKLGKEMFEYIEQSTKCEEIRILI